MSLKSILAGRGVPFAAFLLSLMVTTSVIGVGIAGDPPASSEDDAAPMQVQTGIEITDISATNTDRNVYQVRVRVTENGEPLSDAAVHGFIIGAMNRSMTLEERQPGVYVTTINLFDHGIYRLEFVAEKADVGRATETMTVSHALEEFNFRPARGWYVSDTAVTVSVAGTTYRAYRAWNQSEDGQDGQATWLILTTEGRLAPRSVTQRAAFAAMVKFHYLRDRTTREQTLSEMDLMIDLWEDELLDVTDFEDLSNAAFILRKIRDTGTAILTEAGIKAGLRTAQYGLVGAKVGAAEGLVEGTITSLIIGLPAGSAEIGLIHHRVTSKLDAGARNMTSARRIVHNYDGGPLPYRTADVLFTHTRQGTMAGFGAMYTRAALIEGKLSEQVMDVYEQAAETAASEGASVIGGELAAAQVEGAITAKDLTELNSNIDEAWKESRFRLESIEARFDRYEREATVAPELRSDLNRLGGAKLVGEVTLAVTPSLDSSALEPDGSTTLTVTVRDSAGERLDADVSYHVLETDSSGEVPGSAGQFETAIRAPSTPGGYTLKVTVEALGETVAQTLSLSVRPGNLEATPSTWDIGQVTSDTVEETTITLENTGDVGIDVSAKGGSGLAISNVPDRLAPGETGSFTARLEAGDYTGAPIVVTFAGGKLVVPIDLTVVKDEELTDSWTEELSDEYYDCAFIADVTGPDAACDERDWRDDIDVDAEELDGLATATLTISYRPGGPEKQDNPLEVYLNGEQVDTLPSPSDNDQFTTADIDIAVSDVEAENVVRMETDGASSYDIGDDTEFYYSYFEPPFLLMEFGEFEREVVPGDTVRVPVKIANDGGRPASDVLLGLGSDTDYDAIEVVKWPDGYGPDDARSLEPKQNDVRYFVIRLLSETEATVEIAAGGDNTHTDETFTLRPPNDPPTVADVTVTPAKDVSSAGFEYAARVFDPDGDTVELTLQVFDPSEDTWRDVGTQPVQNGSRASWRFRGFDAADQATRSRFRIIYDDGYGHTGTWGTFPGPYIQDNDTRGPTFTDWQFPASISPGESIPVIANITDPAGVRSATLRFVYPNGTEGSVEMTVEGGEWTAIIPPAASNNRGGPIAFSVEATDGDSSPSTAQSLQHQVWVRSGTLDRSVAADPGIELVAPTVDDPANVSPDGGTVTLDVRITLRGTATDGALQQVLDAGSLGIQVGGSGGEVVAARTVEAEFAGNTSWVELEVQIEARTEGRYDLTATLQRSNPCWPSNASEPCPTEVLRSKDTNEGAVVVGSGPVESSPRATAHWALDDRGPTVPDRSANRHDGTVHGDPELVPGVAGKAYRFDGVDDFVLVNMSESLETEGSFTISMWVRPTEATAREGGSTALGLYTYNGNGKGEGVRIHVHRSSVNFQARHSDGFGQPGGGATNDPYYHIPGEPPALTTGRWHHVALRYDATAGTISLLINGTEAAALLAPKPPRVDDTYLLIGARPASDGGDYPNELALDHFAGEIDAVRIYHTTLSTSVLVNLTTPGRPTATPESRTDSPEPSTAPGATAVTTAGPTVPDTGDAISGDLPVNGSDLQQVEERVVELPGFTPVTAVIALVIVAALFRRRRA